MKKVKIFLFILALVTYCQCSLAQWAPLGAMWFTGIRESISSPAQGYLITTSNSDTVIMGESCKVLINEMHHSFSPAFIVDTFYMFEDSGIVYEFVNGQFSTLYNFNAVQGDTWNISVPYPSPFASGNPPDTIVTIYVDSTSSTIISGQSKKILYVHSLNNDWLFRNPIIESIGGSGGVHPFIYGWMDIDIPYLRCYSDSLISYQNPQAFPCDSLVSSVSDDFNGANNFLIYPNPALSFLEIIKVKPISDMKICMNNILGQSQRINIISENEYSLRLDVCELSSGVYYIILQLGNEIFRTNFYKY